MDLEKYIKKKEYNPDIDKTEIWIGNFSNTPEYDPIDIISGIILNFKGQNEKIIIDDFFEYNSTKKWKKPLIFCDIIFNKVVLFIFNSFDQNIQFTNCIFSKNVFFVDCRFEKTVKFTGCIFSAKTDFSEVIFEGDTNFSRSTFSVISFQDTIFQKNVRFHESIFEETANFTNTKFQRLADFYLVKFHKAQQFHLTDFLDRAIFSNTVFHEEAQFLYNRVENNSYINFESAKFKRGLDISRSNFNCNLNFWNITIEEEGEKYIFKNLENVKYKDDFGEHKEDAVPSVYKQIRETYCIIKNELYSQNNKIEGLEFSKKEMLVYERELKSVSSRSNNDKLLLLANKISNNFGTNWFIGVKFTTLVALITYVVITLFSSNVTLQLDAEGVGNFLKALVDVLNLTDWNDMTILGEKLTNWQYIFLFIGRIFIAYGIYQTVQAFRKYGKS